MLHYYHIHQRIVVGTNFSGIGKIGGRWTYAHNGNQR